MKRSYRFAQSLGTVSCLLETGVSIELPLFIGILKHPTADLLRSLLSSKPSVVRKYTREALCRAPWPILRQFPREWLLQSIEDAPLTPGRRAALVFLLGR